MYVFFVFRVGFVVYSGILVWVVYVGIAVTECILLFSFSVLSFLYLYNVEPLQ